MSLVVGVTNVPVGKAGIVSEKICFEYAQSMHAQSCNLHVYTTITQ